MRKVIWLLFLLNWKSPLAPAAQSSVRLELLNRGGQPTQSITDGDLVQLRLRLAQPVVQDSQVAFLLGRSQTWVAACSVSSGAQECTTPQFQAFGWYWTDGPSPSQAERALSATVNDQALDTSLPITVRPRPVILVHGFLSDYTAWLRQS